MKEFAQALDALNVVAMRQAIRDVELAAASMRIERALRVDVSAPNAGEQVKLWTELMETVIRDFSAWSDSLN